MGTVRRLVVSILGVALAMLISPIVVSLAHEGDGSAEHIHACFRVSDGAMIRMAKNPAIQGVPGVQGDPAVSGYDQRSAFDAELTPFTVAAGASSGPKLFDCPSGKKVLTGGYQVNSTTAVPGVSVDSNRAVDSDTWLLQVTNWWTGANAQDIFVFPVLICATAP